MNRQMIIRGAAVSMVAITASVFVASEFLGENQPLAGSGIVSGGAPDIRAAGLVSPGQPDRPVSEQPAPIVQAQVSALDLGPLDPVIQNDIEPQLVFADQGAVGAVVDCQAALTAEASVDGLIALRLSAPCHADERVVISHGDLAFSAVLDNSGVYSAYVPALAAQARVDVFLSDDTYLQAEATVPDFDDYARLILQWTGANTMALNAYHRGAAYGEDGHIHAQRPFDPMLEGAFLVALGDPFGLEPMLAQVYSVPLAHSDKARVQLEVVTNAQTCGQELSAFVMPTHGAGAGDVRDLQISMPDCGDADGLVILDLPFGARAPVAEGLEFTSDRS